METQTASGILTQAADTLTEKEWAQGGYFFQEPDNTLCRCAHGHIQWCGRDETFRKAVVSDGGMDTLNTESSVEIPVADNKRITVVSVVNTSLTLNDQRLQDLLQEGEKYPTTFNRALFMAHSYAARVGLTFVYNAEAGRTSTEIVAKLREAAALALSEGE